MFLLQPVPGASVQTETADCTLHSRGTMQTEGKNMYPKGKMKTKGKMQTGG